MTGTCARFLRRYRRLCDGEKQVQPGRLRAQVPAALDEEWTSEGSKGSTTPFLTMGLTGRLSNPGLTTLLQRLTAHDWKQAGPPHRSAGGIAPDGRRKFGTVRDAIVQVLAQTDSALRVRDIQKGVEKTLGGPVSGSSVRNYLRKGCRRRAPLFEYRGRSGYRLAGPESADRRKSGRRSPARGTPG